MLYLNNHQEVYNGFKDDRKRVLFCPNAKTEILQAARNPAPGGDNMKGGSRTGGLGAKRWPRDDTR